jgi:predicted Zn-dependent protease
MSIRTFGTVALLLLTAACAVNPATGRREFMLVSEQQEVALGRESDPAIVAQFGLVDDPALQEYVTDLGLRLAAGSERPDLPWSFKVVDDPLVNAFALPGGYIYVTRGILAHFDSEAELAGVLGHEIGHVTARHGASQMSRQQLQQIGLGIGMIASETFRQYSALAATGLQLMNLSYSRDDESQSDRLGLRYISRLDYDADAMIGVFEMLATAGGGSGEGRLPEWQSTHPYPETRSADMRAEIQRTGVSRQGLIERDRYLDMLDGMVYGEDPRNGYFEGQRFLHPDLAFELSFPDGWSTVNQRDQVGAVSAQEDAIVVLGVASDVASPADGVRAFLSQDGITGGPLSESEATGVTTARANFAAQGENGTMEGEVAFHSYGGVTYRMLGYAAAANWSARRASVASTISSFASVTDRSVLSIQPSRLRIVTLPEAMSLNSFVRSNPQPLETEELARLNRVSPSEVISGGTPIKVVEGASR